VSRFERISAADVADGEQDRWKPAEKEGSDADTEADERGEARNEVEVGDGPGDGQEGGREYESVPPAPLVCGRRSQHDISLNR
jgi:hypothetical protein